VAGETADSSVAVAFAPAALGMTNRRKSGQEAGWEHGEEKQFEVDYGVQGAG
jgi:hypothetical protein